MKCLHGNSCVSTSSIIFFVIFNSWFGRIKDKVGGLSFYGRPGFCESLKKRKTMKKFYPFKLTKINAFLALAGGTIFILACSTFSGGGGSRGGTGWKVWVKTSPCAGGTDGLDFGGQTGPNRRWRGKFS